MRRWVLALLLLSGCRTSHVVVEVTDTFGLSSDATHLAFAVDSSGQRRRPIPASGFPVNAVLTASRGNGRFEVVVEAWGQSGEVLARGRGMASFRVEDHKAVTINLGAACDSGVDDGSLCELPGISDRTLCVAGVCRVSICGDGYTDGARGEECDQGADDTSSEDDCFAPGDPRACLRNTCGDGVRNLLREECDDGNGNDEDDCRNSCEQSFCGDGAVNRDPTSSLREDCDDGNNDDFDNCLGICLVNRCGDGILNPLAGDTCDDGNANENDGCAACQLTRWEATEIFGVDAVLRANALPLGADPVGLAHDARDNLWILLDGDPSLLQVLRSNGFVESVAGLDLGRASSMVMDGRGRLYLPNADRHEVLRWDPATATEMVVPGTGSPALDTPRAIAIDLHGVVYVANDTDVRRVDTDSTVTPLVTLPPGPEVIRGLVAGPDDLVYILLQTTTALGPCVAGIRTADYTLALHSVPATGAASTTEVARIVDTPTAYYGGWCGFIPGVFEIADRIKTMLWAAPGVLYVADPFRDRGTRVSRVRKVDVTTSAVETLGVTLGSHLCAMASDRAGGLWLGGFRGGLAGFLVPGEVARSHDPENDLEAELVLGGQIWPSVDTGPLATTYGNIGGGFSERSVGVTPDGSIVFSERNGVRSINSAGEAWTTRSFGDGPFEITVDGDVIVSAADGDGLVRFPPGCRECGVSDVFAGDPRGLTGVTVDPDGRVVFVGGYEGAPELGLWRGDPAGHPSLIAGCVAPCGNSGLLDTEIAGGDVISAGPDRYYVSQRVEGQILEIDVAAQTASLLLDFPGELRGIAAEGQALYAASYGTHEVIRVDLSDCTPQCSWVVVAGNGVDGWSGDNGLATDAAIEEPAGVAVSGGNLYVNAKGSIRRIELVSGRITTIAGNVDSVGDHRLELAYLESPRGIVSLDLDRHLVSSDRRIRIIDPTHVRTAIGYPGGHESGEARFARLLRAPQGLALGNNRLFVAESHGVVEIDLSPPWTVQRVLGDAVAGHVDGDLATSRFDQPTGLALTPDGDALYVAEDNTVRRVDLAGDRVDTIAGVHGYDGFNGDGLGALDSWLANPESVAVAANGSVYIADTGNHLVRRVVGGGVGQPLTGAETLEIVMGDLSGSEMLTRDQARLSPVGQPRAVAIDRHGNLFVAAGELIALISPGEDDVVTGDDPVEIIYRADEGLPLASCPVALDFTDADGPVDDDSVTVLSCNGIVFRLTRTPE